MSHSSQSPSNFLDPRTGEISCPMSGCVGGYWHIGAVVENDSVVERDQIVNIDMDGECGH